MNMQDPMSQMAQAQKLSIGQLQQALRDGTINPQVGQIVLASKISADKQAKMSMAAQAPKQPPVAQQNMAYGQGVPALPSNLPAAGMAGGGIISFAGNTDGSLVPQDGLADDQYSIANEQALGGSNPYAYIPAALGDAVTAPFGYRTVWDPKTKTFRRAKDVEGLTPRIDALNAARTGRVDALKSGIDTRISDNSAKQYTAQAAKTPFVKADPNAPMSQRDMALLSPPTGQDAMAANPSADDRLKQLNDFFGSGNIAGGSRTKGSQGIDGLSANGYKITPYTDAQKQLTAAMADELNPATGKEWTYDEKAAERKANQASAGIDFGLYDKQKAELEATKKLPEGRERLNEALPWLAFAEQMTKPTKTGEAPASFISGLASSTLKAAITKGEISDKEKDRLDKIRTEGNSLALAQNQFNQAQFNGTEADVKESRNALKSARTNLTNLGVKGIDQQNEAAKVAYETNAKVKIAGMQEEGAWARLGKENATIQGITKAILADNPTMTLSDALNKAYLTKSAGTVYGADSRANASQLTALAGERKALFTKRPLQSSQIPAWQAQLDALDKQINALGGAGATSVANPTAFYSAGNAGDDAIMNKYLR